MREYFLNSQDLLDEIAYDFINKEEIPGILNCKKIKWNDRVQLVYFLDGLTRFSDKKPSLTLNQITGVCAQILDIIVNIENNMDISAENVSCDTDSIYLDEDNDVYMVCLPAVLPSDVLNSRIYVKRIYALIEEMLDGVSGGEAVVRQMEAAKKRSFGDWTGLKDALSSRAAEESDVITLRSINTSEQFVFEIGHEEFYIGADPEKCKGCILGAISVSPVHALIGWNDISFYIQDLGSREGTYLNDIKLTPQIQVPFGKGSIIKFAECTFNVE